MRALPGEAQSRECWQKEMRHPLQGEALMEKCADFACNFVEASGDNISLSHAVYETVKKWFERHEGKPEDSGD